MTGSRRGRRRTGWLWCGLALWWAPPAGAGNVIVASQSDDGMLVCRVPLVLGAPEGRSLNVDRVAVRFFNGDGRLVRVDALDRDLVARLLGGRSGLQPGQELVFSRTERFAPDLGVAWISYAFDVSGVGEGRRRIVRNYAIGRALADLPATELVPLDEPRLGIYVVPEPTTAVRLPRSGRLAWPVRLWVQETGGAAVTIESIEWAARLGGEPGGEAKLDSATVAALAGSATVGPDGFLSVGGQGVGPTDSEAGELLVLVNGATESGRKVTAMARAELRPPLARPALTPLRLPVRGEWRVRQGPGDPAFVGDDAYTWVFEAVDGQGRAYRGEGKRLKDHYSWDQPVLAPAAGQVLAQMAERPDAEQPVGNARFGGGMGENYVVIDHGNGELSYLGGLRRDSLRVPVGARVEAGAEIARVGNSGDGQRRPGLTYRLLRSDGGGRLLTLEARFGGYTHLFPDGPSAVASGAPDPGDIVRAP